ATTVTVIGKRATVACRLRLDPQAGGADAVVIQVAGAAEPWDWQVARGPNRVRSVQPLTLPPTQLLAGLAARSPWEALSANGLADVLGTDGSPWYRTFRYSAGAAALALIPNDDNALAKLDRARQVTYATDSGRLVHCLHFRLRDWARPTVPIDLPADAVVQQV